jgi:hypothetical protein
MCICEGWGQAVQHLRQECATGVAQPEDWPPDHPPQTIWRRLGEQRPGFGGLCFYSASVNRVGSQRPLCKGVSRPRFGFSHGEAEWPLCPSTYRSAF